MDIWGNYTRATTNQSTGETTTDNVLLQADPVNKARYERKGYTFVDYASTPGVGPALQPCGVDTAAEQIWGFRSSLGDTPLDDAEIVKQAAEVALRKMTGTWTQAEAEAEEVAHAQGQYKPEETEFAIVEGDPLAGFKALVGDGANPTSPGGYAAPTVPSGASSETGTGGDGTGTVAPAPTPAP